MIGAGVLLDARLVALRCTLPLAVRTLPLPRLFRLIAPRRVSTSERRARRSIARSEVMALRLGTVNTCMYRAMARFVALRAAGVDARFVMGVRRDDLDLGHAWIEVDGVTIMEETDARLVATWSFP